jgi:hypothetical protein
MKTALAALLALTMSTLPALAVPVTAEQKADFYKTCMGIASDEPLCTCKADAAVELIDSDFMSLVISAMKGQTYPADEQGTYDAYIMRSNGICKPGY